MPNVTQVRGTIQTLLTTELNSLANNSNAVHASSVTFTNPGYMRLEVELVYQFATAPTANTNLQIWFLREIDGVNFESGSASVTPLRRPDVIVTVGAFTTVQRYIEEIPMPPGTIIRPLVRNAGTGQALVASGNTLKIVANTDSF